MSNAKFHTLNYKKVILVMEKYKKTEETLFFSITPSSFSAKRVWKIESFHVQNERIVVWVMEILFEFIAIFRKICFNISGTGEFMKKHRKIIIFTNIILLIALIVPMFISKEVRIQREYENTEAREMKLAIWSFPNAEKYRTDEELEAICQGLSDMGVRYVYNEQEWGVQTLNRLMDCYEKYGIKSIIGLPINEQGRALEIVRATKDHPVCWGYNLKDEPATQEFTHLSEMAAIIRAEIPEDKKITTNMLPNASFTWGGLENVSLGAYKDYLKGYIEITGVDTLSFDCYPLGKDYSISDEELVYYLKNLMEFNIQCREAGIEATSIIQSARWEDRRMPTDTELNFLVNLNLVSGMDGITYFLYWTNVGRRGRVIFQGLMNYDGTPHPLYFTAQEINQGLGKMKGVFIDYDQVGYIFTNAPEAYWNFEEGIAPASAIMESFGPVKAVKSSASVLSGCFTKEDGKKALYVMNFNFTAGEKEKITLELSGTTDYKIWNYTGLADLDETDNLVLELVPGEAAFIEFD